MNIQELGSLGEVVAAVATVATLVFVAFQIRENTSWLKRQSHESVADRFTTWFSRVRENPEIYDLYLRGRVEFESFTDQERELYHLTMLEVMLTIELMLVHSEAGAVREGAIGVAEHWVRQVLGSPGARMWWEDMGKQCYAPEYVDRVDTVLKDGAT